MDIEAAREWANKRLSKVEERYMEAGGDYRGQLILCARLAVAEHERAENWEGYATALAKDGTKKAERDVCAGENLTARFYSAQQPTRAKGYWWCPRCEQQIDPGLHDCGSECSWVELEATKPAVEQQQSTDPKLRRELWREAASTPDPLAVDLRVAGRVYRRALVAIREVERIQEAISKGYPRPADSAADIAARLRLFARAVATDLGDDFELVERKSAELEIEHREEADVWERESTAAMLERLLPGEAGAILSCLVRGCFQHWSPDDGGIPEDLSFTDD